MKKYLGCLLWIWLSVGFSLNSLQSLRVQPLSSATMVEMMTSKVPQLHCFYLSNPVRYVIDLQSTRLSLAVKKIKIQNQMIRKLRFSEDAQKTRLVFDLKQHYQIQQTAPSLKQGHYLLRFYFSDVAARPKTVASLSQPFPPSSSSLSLPIAPASKPVLVMPQLTLSEPEARNIIVMIDPGHGGKDPGATGVNRRHEKEVVLAIAKKLQADLNQQKGFTAKLTRTGDYYLTLRQRLDIARKNKGDVFISIHADAYNNKTARGASVFALSQRGATSEAARWLAERENRSELMGGVTLADKGNILRSVLIDLSQTATIGASLKMGQQLLSNLSQVTVLHHDGVEQAAFVVLKSPDIPSLLVETGFMSSQREAALLTSSNYQSSLALSIMQGIKQYFVQHPPPGTWIAAMEKNQQRYYVRPGDTLEKIASLNHLSKDSIIAINSLSPNVPLALGQVLLLPNKG